MKGLLEKKSIIRQSSNSIPLDSSTVSTMTLFPVLALILSFDVSSLTSMTCSAPKSTISVEDSSPNNSATKLLLESLDNSKAIGIGPETREDSFSSLSIELGKNNSMRSTMLRAKNSIPLCVRKFFVNDQSLGINFGLSTSGTFDKNSS